MQTRRAASGPFLPVLGDSLKEEGNSSVALFADGAAGSKTANPALVCANAVIEPGLKNTDHFERNKIGNVTSPETGGQLIEIELPSLTRSRGELR